MNNNTYLHRRHNFNALLPRWFSSSDALALSHSKHITGDTTMTSLCRAESEKEGLAQWHPTYVVHLIY